MNKLRLGLACALALLPIAAPSAARAADSVRLEEHEKNGYFDKFGRFGVFYGSAAGDMPSAATDGPTLPSKGYKRNGFGVEVDMLGFWDATRFDTLLGAEFKSVFGSYASAKIDGEAESASDKNYLMFRLDAAADYGLLHWDGPIKGRISGGAGAGFDFDGGKWYASQGRAYTQLLGRVQLFAGNLGLHASYHWIPGTGGSNFVREHRFEGAAAMGSIQGGLRAIITTVRPGNFHGEGGPLVAREFQIFIAYAF